VAEDKIEDRKDADDDKDKVEDRKDADAGSKLDDILKCVDAIADGMTSRLDEAFKRMDAMEERFKDARKDAEDKDKIEDRKDKVEDRKDRKDRKDKVEDRKDAEDKDDDKTKPEETAADRKDAEDKDKVEDRKDAEDKDDDKMNDSAFARTQTELSRVRNQLRDVESRLPKVITDAEYHAMADTQSKYDSVFLALGDAQGAPRPLQQEDHMGYRRRLANRLKAHAPRFKDIDILSINDAATFDYMEEQVFKDAQEAALHPADLPPATLREIKTRDATGREISTFVGDSAAFIGQFTGPARRMTRLGLPG